MGHANQSLAAKECRRWSDCVPPKVLGQKDQARFFWSIQKLLRAWKEKDLGGVPSHPASVPNPVGSDG